MNEGHLKNHNRFRGMAGALWSAFVLLASTTPGCADKEKASNDIEALCGIAMMNLQPGSGVHWGEADEYNAWHEGSPSALAREAVGAYGDVVEAKRKATGRSALSKVEHVEIFREALTSRGLTVPNCDALLGYWAHREVFTERIWELYPLCEAYGDRVAKVAATGVGPEEHDRIFKEVATAWRSSSKHSAAALALVDRLVDMGREERGARIYPLIIEYLTAPGSLNRCTQLVWDAERAAGMPKRDIR